MITVTTSKTLHITLHQGIKIATYIICEILTHV